MQYILENQFHVDIRDVRISKAHRTIMPWYEVQGLIFIAIFAENEKRLSQ